MAKKTAQTKTEPNRFPSASEILRFIEESPTPVGKREIARAFKIKGADRPRLKEILRELKVSGELNQYCCLAPAREPPYGVEEITAWLPIQVVSCGTVVRDSCEVASGWL